MVEKEVKKKTSVYSAVAILTAMILVTLIFVFGSPGFVSNPPLTTPSEGTPGTSPGTTPGTSPGTNPGTNPGGTPNTNPGTNPGVAPEVSPMKTFISLEELKTYLTTNSKGTAVYGGGPLDKEYFVGGDTRGGLPAVPSQTPSLAVEGSGSANSYSTTNIQVAGVDEADTTKNDGSYIYTASNDYQNGNYVYIVKADPSDPRVVAKIRLENDTYLAGMFLSQDSSKLAIIGSQYRVYTLLGGGGVGTPSLGIAFAPNYYGDVKTFVNVYDISDKVHPTLARNFTLSGSYFNSRMIGDYVYAVVSQSAFVYNDSVPLPAIYNAADKTEISPTRIYYSDSANYAYLDSNYFTFTSFYGLNLKDTSQLTNMTVLMGGASTMYVSLGNMYVTYPTWSNGQYTSIYRVSIDSGKLTFQAKGSVLGSVLNQYSMDEDKGFFRLATTTWNDTTQNSVYVLNMNLTTVGALQLQNAEIRETIQSARFIGDKAYVVTFQQKDPFFVLDMSNPAAPRVAGKLEIPGYSSYLHPYDENHIIGLGMENRTVKLSLFDVTNVNAPREIAKYIVQGDYAYSQAMYDPKAFLFDQAKQLLVIPMSVTTYGVVSPVPEPGGRTIAPTQPGYWEGAYVFRLTLSGFELRGTVTHQTATDQYGYNYTLSVNRALYIGNTLYTVSNAKVKLNSLTNLAPIAEVNLK